MSWILVSTFGGLGSFTLIGAVLGLGKVCDVGICSTIGVSFSGLGAIVRVVYLASPEMGATLN